MYVYRLIPGGVSLAHGGALIDDPSQGATHTRAGRFVIGSIGPHISSKRWLLSTIPWGTPLRLNVNKDLEVQLNGRWTALYTLPAWRDYYASYPPGATIFVRESYWKLMTRLQTTKYRLSNRGKFPAPWNGEFPPTWVLNDFGRIAVKYFADYNGNRKLDGKERLLSDFIHTTPDEEMETLLDKKLDPATPMNLGESHGCIHLIPDVLQDWVKRGILAVGATLEVHKYAETKIPNSFERRTGRAGVEIHFFPGALGIALYRVTKKQLGHSLHLSHSHG